MGCSSTSQRDSAPILLQIWSNFPYLGSLQRGMSRPDRVMDIRANGKVKGGKAKVAKDKEGEGHKANLAIRTGGLKSLEGPLQPKGPIESTEMKAIGLVLLEQGAQSLWTSV